MLAYLSRYTHRVAIANSRLVACDDTGVTFKYKDYRAGGPARYKVMTLATGEFIRRFLSHVLPGGFHCIRYYILISFIFKTILQFDPRINTLRRARRTSCRSG